LQIPKSKLQIPNKFKYPNDKISKSYEHLACSKQSNTVYFSPSVLPGGNGRCKQGLPRFARNWGKMIFSCAGLDNAIVKK